MKSFIAREKSSLVHSDHEGPAIQLTEEPAQTAGKIQLYKFKCYNFDTPKP